MRSAYQDLTTSKLDEVISGLEIEFASWKEKQLHLDMSRGKPSPEQVKLSMPLLDVLNSTSSLSDGDAIVDNYGSPDGLPSARALAAEILGVSPASVIVSGSSSVNLMHDLVARAFTHGVLGGEPFYKQGKIRWLCPAPGYDRHFTITESFGFENIAIPMTDEGPDMDLVRSYVEHDPSVKGIWCNPKFSNPTGICYSDRVVKELVDLTPAAPDFRIYWDNAYAVHNFYDEDTELLNIFAYAKKQGVKNRVYGFGSFAKITFPSSAIAFLCADTEDFASIHAAFNEARVSSEKFSQLIHARYFSGLADVRAHMKLHAHLLRPRFDLVEHTLTQKLSPCGVASWSHPKGGYFVDLEVVPGCAKAIVDTMKEAGVLLTDAGACWPGGKDPHDTTIRIAPTYPSMQDLSCALEVLCCVTKLVCAKKLRHKLD